MYMLMAVICVILLQISAVAIGIYCLCRNIETSQWKIIHRVNEENC
jgi:hypothetical protein